MAFRSAAVHFLMFSPLRAPLYFLSVPCFPSWFASFPFLSHSLNLSSRLSPSFPFPSPSPPLQFIYLLFTFFLSFPTCCLPCSVVLFRPFRFPSYFSSFPLHPPSPTSSAVSSFTSSICSPFLSQEVGGVAQW